MPDDEEFSKFLLQLLLDIGDDKDLLARFRKTSGEILELSGVWSFHKKPAANDLAAIILSEMVEWITFERQSILLFSFRKLLSFVKEKSYGVDEIEELLEHLESSFTEMREVWKKTEPDLTELIPPKSAKN
jgi:hypothetical protein